MKKVGKGEYGYLNYRKKRLGVATMLCFLVVAVFFLIGYLTTKTRNNIMTIMAILSVLPAGKFAASFFALLPYQGASKEQYKRVMTHADGVQVLADLVITTGQKTLPTLFMAVHNSSVCGYVNAKNYDIAHAEQFLTKNLMENGQKATVKIFRDEKVFLNRLDTMRQIEIDEKQREKDTRIEEILLTLIM